MASLVVVPVVPRKHSIFLRVIGNHSFFSSIDFIGKLAALVPPPRLNLPRFYGVFAPNANVRAEVTASRRGKNSPLLAEHLKDSDKPYHAERHHLRNHCIPRRLMTMKSRKILILALKNATTNTV